MSQGWLLVAVHVKEPCIRFFRSVFSQSGQRAVISAPSRGVRRETSIGRLKFGHRFV